MAFTPKGGKLLVSPINLAAALAGTGVTVNAYRPGSIDTAMQTWIRNQNPDAIGRALYDRFTERHAAGDLITPEASAKRGHRRVRQRRAAAPALHRIRNGGSWMALPSASALLLFSFLGMEGAAVATKRVRDPERNVPRAIVAGVAGVAVLHLAGTLAVQGTVPQALLAESGAPFADAAQAIFGGAWAAKAIAAVALISALGSLNGFNLINSEMAAGAAHDGLFPRPLRRRVRGLPVPALVLNAILATALIAFEATGDPLALFTTLALLSTFVYVFGYVLSVAAELCHSLVRRTRSGPPAGTVAIAAIALAMVFSVWMAGATGAEAMQRGTVLILIGIPVYVVTRRTNPSGRSGAMC